MRQSAKLKYNNVMRYYAVGLSKIMVFIVLVVSITAALLRLSPVIFPDVPEPTPHYDCDDGTLFMYQHFQRSGFEVTPILGNLDLTGEIHMECNHVWLLVKFGGKNIAYDWGKPQFDKQYYEGYAVDLDYLLCVTADDINNSNT